MRCQACEVPKEDLRAVISESVLAEAIPAVRLLDRSHHSWHRRARASVILPESAVARSCGGSAPL